MIEKKSTSWRGDKIGKMSKREMDDFLTEPWIARLACIKPDGSPFVVPVWYHWDGSAFWIVGRKKSRWAEFLEADPRVSLVIDEPVPPIRKVICDGKAEMIEKGIGPFLENGEKSVWNQIGENHTGPRYLGEKAIEYRKSVNSEPCTTFKIQPLELMTWQGFEWHRRYRHS